MCQRHPRLVREVHLTPGKCATRPGQSVLSYSSEPRAQALHHPCCINKVMDECSPRSDHRCHVVKEAQEGEKISLPSRAPRDGCSVRDIQPAIVEVSRASFFFGRCTCCCRVSISMPRNVITVVGSSVFSSATGNPSSWQISNVADRCSAHDAWPGGPKNRKSSR